MTRHKRSAQKHLWFLIAFFLSYEGHAKESFFDESQFKLGLNYETDPKEERVIREELSLRHKLRASTMSFSFFSNGSFRANQRSFQKENRSAHLFSEKKEKKRNLRITGPGHELRFQELYGDYSKEELRIRYGNQLYHWSKADVIKPSNFINPLNLREPALNSKDQMLGVPSTSLSYFLEEGSFELVYIPYHIKPILPVSGNYWTPTITEQAFDMEIHDQDALPKGARNRGYAGRYSGYVAGIDYILSGYEGPDQDVLFVPTRTEAVPASKLKTMVEPYYNRVTFGGLGLSYARDGYGFTFDSRYSPRKAGLDQEAASRIDEPGGLPVPVLFSPHLSYSLGVNAFLPSGEWLGTEGEDSLLILEWHDSKYTKSTLSEDPRGQLFSVGVVDTAFNDKLETRLATIFATKTGGKVYATEVSFQYLPSSKVTLSYKKFASDSPDSQNLSSPLSQFHDKETVHVALEYSF